MYLLYLLLLALLVYSSFNNVEGIKSEGIIGGTPVTRGRFKYVVAVMYKSPRFSDYNVCTGSIIANQFIATAAHCFYDKIFGEWRTRFFYIAVGVHNLMYPLPTTRCIAVDTVFIPRTYNPNNPDTYSTQGNLAIVKLKQKLGLKPDHPTLTKLVIRNVHLSGYGGTFHVAGYGFKEVTVIQEEINGRSYYTRKGVADGKMRYSKARILTHRQCTNMIKDDIAPGNLCVKINRTKLEQPVGICERDSGAPLTHHGFLDGIAINGFPACDEEQMPGIYLDILYYSKFIKNVLEDRITSDMYIMQLLETEPDEFEFTNISIPQEHSNL